MAFIADDLGAWLVGLLADAGRKRLTSLVLGSDQERALRQAATAAVQRTAGELDRAGGEQGGQLALVVSEIFGEPVPGVSLAGDETLLEGLKAGIARQLAPLDDAGLTGVGQSSAGLLGVPARVLAEMLAGHLVREIMLRGSRGGPLAPLAEQLNHDVTHLQGQRLEGMLARLAGEARDALARRAGGAAAEASRPVTEVAVPPGVGNLPPRPVLFVGRAGEMARLDEALAGPGGVVVQAVHGLGGIGKSTLAAHWASAHVPAYLLVWWITADSAASVDAGLAALAVALQPALAGALPPEALRERAVQWLAAHQKWLVVLDNVTDPADIAPLLGRAVAGRYLITSRRATGWHKIAATVRLDVLDEAEAGCLLTGILAWDGPRELDGADELCAELGFLPLAIEQAGAYIAETGITPREYLQLLAQYPAAMYQAATEGGDAARTIARIWHVTLDRLADDPLTGQVLRILAWFAPDNIPRTLLDGLADPPALLRAVGRLGAYNMLTADRGTLAVHRLVQAVTRTPAPGDPHRDPTAIASARDQAASQLADALPDWQDPAGWPAWQMLLPHIDAMTRHTQPDTDTIAMAGVVNLAGLFLNSQGQATQAVGHLQRALTSWQRILGSGHPQTLTSRNNLAWAYQTAGDLGRAIPLYEQTLADRQRMLGSDHPDTLTFRNNLALAYQAAGDLGRAIPLFEQTLADRQRVLGGDHPDTLTSRNNLAYAYQAAGDLGRAI